MPIQTVLDYLDDYSGLTALVGERMSPLIRDQNETLPCVTLSLVSVDPQNHLNGAPTLDQNRVQIDSWATTYAGARAVAAAVRTALESAGLNLISEFDTFESDVNEYRVTQDFSVWT
jgi:hypothetical protein